MKIASKETYKDLWKFMAGVKLKANKYSIDTSITVGIVFKDSFLVDDDITKGEIETMVGTCIYINDKSEVIYAIVDDNLDVIEKKDSYESEEEAEEAVYTPVKLKYIHLEAVKAMDLFQSYMDKTDNEASGDTVSKTLNQMRRIIRTSYFKSSNK